MMARFAILSIVVASLLAGAGLYYTQVYAYYYEVTAEQAGGVLLTSVVSGAPEAIPFDNFRAIDSDSSPLRFRACFTTGLTQAALETAYRGDGAADPLNGPGWFDCYDAKDVGEALESGTAKAFLGVENIHYGIDRVVAILPDGRGFAWHQMNPCGEAVYNGEPAPDGCPPAPEGVN